MAKNLQGTKTHQNLKDAFAGESQANRRYLYFAKVADVEGLPWKSQLERILGCALATADLLGQMAAPDYVDKLPILYLEFAEAARHDGRKAARLASYNGPDELLRNTPLFWQSYVLPRINDEFEGLHHFLNDPYPDGPNEYLQRIEENIAVIQSRVGAG